MEKQISFNVQGRKLYGMIHLPKEKGPFPSLAFFHGFTGHSVETHRLFVKAARRFAGSGIACLRFSFRGSGESEGDFFDMTVQDEIEDGLKSLEFLRSQKELDPRRIGVLGLSLGGFVAAHVAGQEKGLKALVLWAAGARPFNMTHSVCKNMAFLNKNRRISLSDIAGKHEEQKAAWRKQGYADFNGLTLSRKFLDRLEKMQDPLLKLGSSFKGKALVIHGQADPVVPVSEAEAYRLCLKRKAEVNILKGVDHTFNRVDWERKVLGTTAVWLKKNL